MSGTRSAAPKVPVTERDWPNLGLILAVHGIRRGPGGARQHREALAARRLFGEVGMGVHKGGPDLVESVHTMARTRPVVVVPLLMAAAYTLRAMRTRLAHAFPHGARPLLTRPLGTHPRFAELIVNEGKLGCAQRGWQQDNSGLLLVGHGTRRDPTSGGTTRRHAAMVMASRTFREVGIAFLDEPPSVPEALARFTTPYVVVVGLFLDRGEHGEEDIPELLQPFGPRAHYTGPVGLDPLVPDLVLDQLRTLAADAAA